MIPIKIESAQISDIPAIIEIHRECIIKINAKYYPNKVIKEWLEPITEENIKKQFINSSWIVAKAEDKIIGFAQFSFKESEIYQINASPDHKNQGVGKKLYGYIENEFKNKKIDRISLYSTHNAVKFYKKMGFVRTGTEKLKLKNEYFEAIKMEKIL